MGTNLPEIAITSTAAANHNLGIAVGNLLGGIAIQTVVLAALDIAVRGKKRLTYRAASITLVLETLLVVAVLAVAILGTRLAPSLVLWRVTPQNLLILLTWLGGLWLLKRAAAYALDTAALRRAAEASGSLSECEEPESWKHSEGDGQVWRRGHRYPWRRHCA